MSDWKISHISSVHKCGHTCGKFHDRIFEKACNVSPKNPKSLLRSVIWYNSRKECSNILYIHQCLSPSLFGTDVTTKMHTLTSINRQPCLSDWQCTALLFNLPPLDMTFEYFSIVLKHHQHLTLIQTLQISIQMHSHACYAFFKYSLKYLWFFFSLFFLANTPWPVGFLKISRIVEYQWTFKRYATHIECDVVLLQQTGALSTHGKSVATFECPYFLAISHWYKLPSN